MTTLTPSRLAEIETLAKKAIENNRLLDGLNPHVVVAILSEVTALRAWNYEIQFVVDHMKAELASHAALQAEVERLRGQLLVCREAGKMLSGALTSSEDQREAALDRIWDSINAHGGTFEADDLEGKGKCEMIDKALAIIEKEGGVGEVQRLSLKTKEEADDE